MKSGLIDSSGREETILGLRYLVHPHPWLQVETVTPERILRQRFLGQFQDHYQPNHHTYFWHPDRGHHIQPNCGVDKGDAEERTRAYEENTGRETGHVRSPHRQ